MKESDKTEEKDVMNVMNQAKNETIEVNESTIDDALDRKDFPKVELANIIPNNASEFMFGKGRSVQEMMKDFEEREKIRKEEEAKQERLFPWKMPWESGGPRKEKPFNELCEIWGIPLRYRNVNLDMIRNKFAKQFSEFDANFHRGHSLLILKRPASDLYELCFGLSLLLAKEKLQNVEISYRLRGYSTDKFSRLDEWESRAEKPIVHLYDLGLETQCSKEIISFILNRMRNGNRYTIVSSYIPFSHLTEQYKTLMFFDEIVDNL